MTDTAKQWSGAALAGMGIVAIVILAIVRKDIPPTAIVGTLTALAMRAGGLVTHVFSGAVARAVEAQKEEGQ